MKFVVKPSLEHMVLVKIAISLWNQNDVKDLISNLSSNQLYISEKWKTIEGKVTEKLSQLSLPKLLKEKVFGVIKPIGLQLLEWMQFHDRYNLWMNLHRTCLRVDLPAELCWTPQGTVDRKKTARVLVRHESLDLSIRYKLACMYYLEDDICELWNSSIEDLNELTRGLGNANPDSYQDQFDQCVHRGNKVAAEYLLQKLTPREIEESLVEAAKNVRDVDILCFLMEEMDEEQQIEVFKNNPFGVLQCFLKWPLQSFFIEIANCMWDFLSEEDYERLLRKIAHKIIIGCKDWNYQKLFREFWQKSPNAQKSLIINEIHFSWLLPSLFDMKNKENIRLILKDADLTAKDKLVYNYDFQIFCFHSIRDNEWDFLEFCIRECLPTKNLMLKFKEVFEKRMMHSYVFSTKKHEWNKMFLLSDDSVSRIKEV